MFNQPQQLNSSAKSVFLGTRRSWVASCARSRRRFFYLFITFVFFRVNFAALLFDQQFGQIKIILSHNQQKMSQIKKKKKLFLRVKIG